MIHIAGQRRLLAVFPTLGFIEIHGGGEAGVF